MCFSLRYVYQMSFTHLYTLMSSNKLPAFTHALVFVICLPNVLNAFAHTCHTSFYTFACSYVLALWPKKSYTQTCFCDIIEFHAFIHGYVIQNVACIRSCTYLCNMIFKHAFSLSHGLCICTHSYHGTLHTSLHYDFIKYVAHIHTCTSLWYEY